MSLFRRFRRDKEDAPEPEKAAPEEPSPSSEENPSTSIMAVEPATAPSPATAPAARIPPPLPDRPAETKSPAALLLDARAKCFVCGTPLDGHTCPTCRMTWVE